MIEENARIKAVRAKSRLCDTHVNVIVSCRSDANTMYRTEVILFITQMWHNISHWHDIIYHTDVILQRISFKDRKRYLWDVLSLDFCLYFTPRAWMWLKLHQGGTWTNSELILWRSRCSIYFSRITNRSRKILSWFNLPRIKILLILTFLTLAWLELQNLSNQYTIHPKRCRDMEVKSK